MSLPTRHVLIVGAGLGGPCLALCLARHNISSTIFEIRPTRSTSGGSLSLGPNALQVLDKYADVYDHVKRIGYTYRRFGAYSAEGEKFGEIKVADDNEKEGYPSIRVMRTDLNKMLIEEGVAKEGLIDVKFGVKLQKIEENEEGVTAFFEDGTTAKGDILVGADGIHSKVRAHVLGDLDPKPEFCNLCIVTGFLPSSAAVLPTPDFEFPAFMFTPTGLFMVMPIDPEMKTLTWGINKSMPEKGREEWLELERTGEAARQAKADYDNIDFEPVRSLLDNADDMTARLWAPYSLPKISKWHTSRVCLIGDAAHALPPNGQGSALAFEDAAILTRLLTQTEKSVSYETLFAKFQSVRSPRIESMREKNKTYGQTVKSSTNSWGWFFKKLAFRAFFWWNSGVLHHTKETTLDVDKVKLEL